MIALAAAVPVSAAVGAGGLYLRWWDRRPGEGLSVFSTDEWEFVQAAAEAFFPPGGDPPMSGAEADLGNFLDEVLSHFPDRERKGLKLLLQVLDDATIPTHAAAFRHLELETRTAVLQDWFATDSVLFRSALGSLLLLLSEGYCTHPTVVAAIGGFACGYGR
jgi:hypothetical protein